MSPDCFAVGDVVRVREWEDMKSEFGLDHDGDIRCTQVFVTCMSESCGELCTVFAKDGKRVYLDFENPIIDAEVHRYKFSTDMIEPAGYSDINPEAVLSLSDFLSGM